MEDLEIDYEKLRRLTLPMNRPMLDRIWQALQVRNREADQLWEQINEEYHG